MTATALTESQVRALYPSSAAQNQYDKRQWEALGQQKGALRVVQGTTNARSKT